jgi:hypothetical protein
MSSLTASAFRAWLPRPVMAVAMAGMAFAGVTVPANVAPAGTGLPASMNDPGCDMFGWRHPMCAGGAWGSESASQEWGPANTGTNPFPGGGGQMVPNVDGSLSLPGTPGAI